MKKYNDKITINIRQLLPISYLYTNKYNKSNILIILIDILIWMIPFAFIITLFIINIYKFLKIKNKNYAQKESKNLQRK